MKPIKFIKTSLLIALFTLGFTGFSFGQTDQTEEAEADEAGAITEVKLQDQAKAKRDKTAVAIQKDHLKQNILEEIEQVNDALYIIEVQIKERQNEVEGEWMSAIQTLESSLKIYKNNLIHKLEEIDDQTDEDWAEFKDNTKIWWDKVREGIDEAFSAAEQEYAELTE